MDKIFRCKDMLNAGFNVQCHILKIKNSTFQTYIHFIKNRSVSETCKIFKFYKCNYTSCFRKPEVILQFPFTSKTDDQWFANFMKRNSIVGIFQGTFRCFQNSYSLKHERVATSTRCIGSQHVVDTVIFVPINLRFQSLFQLLPLHDFLHTVYLRSYQAKIQYQVQEKPSIGVIRKRHSENMQQICS